MKQALREDLVCFQKRAWRISFDESSKDDIYAAFADAETLIKRLAGALDAASRKHAGERWEVQQFTICGGWCNTWLEGDEPQTFASREDAQAELDAFFVEIQSEIESGERDPDAGYSPVEFRVRPVPS